MKIVRFIFGILIVSVFVLPMKDAKAIFPDVDPTSWSAEHIINLTNLGLISGYPNGNFGPNDGITRLNTARILGRWLIKEHYIVPEDAFEAKRFYDIPLNKDSELVQVTALLAEEGIIIGSQGKINGSTNITREQLALILVRIIENVYDVDLISNYLDAGFKSNITDIQKLSKTSQQAIIALEYVGITSTTSYNPSKTLTRAEFATFLNRTIQYFKTLKDIQAQSSDTENTKANEQAEITSDNTTSVEEELIHSNNSVMNEQTAKNLDNSSEFETLEPSLESNNVVLTNPYTNYTHFTVSNGTDLYSSQNGKRIIGTMKTTSTFPIHPLENEEMLYFEVGGERYYAYSSDVTLVNYEDNINSEERSLGFIRLAGPITLYANEALTIPILTVKIDSRFSVQQINNNLAIMNMNGSKVYVSLADAIYYEGLPYQVLNDTNLLKKSPLFTTVGTLKKGFSILGSTSDTNYIYFKDANTNYAVSKESVLEVDDLYNTGTIAATTSIPVTINKPINIYSVDNALIGTLLKGEKLTVISTDEGIGYAKFAGNTIRFALSSIYHTNLVQSAQSIRYETMVAQLKKIHALYPSFTELIEIGKTVEGRAIYALRLGNGSREIVMDASLHAREYMTTNVLMEMIDEYSNAYARDTTYEGFSVKKILDKTAIWFIPMVNIDGVTLIQTGVNSTSYKNAIIKMNGSSNVARWKANIRGVDLNRNFDGPWAKSATTSAPSWSNFKGYSVFSEPESKALRDFFAKHSFKAYISYHSSGNMLYYWNWQSEANKVRDYAFAMKLSKTTGYYIMKPLYEVGTGSSADWFIRKYQKPGITMEISPYVGNQPVPFSNWMDVWKRNKTIGLLSASESEKF